MFLLLYEVSTKG